MNYPFHFMRLHQVDLLRYLPPFLESDETFKDDEDALSREHESYRLRLIDLAKQFFIETATWSISDWEEFCGVKKQSDDLEARRAAVKAKLLGGETMTLARVNELIKMFAPDGEATEHCAPNELKIILQTHPRLLNELLAALLELTPAHLLLRLELHKDDDQQLYHGAFHYDSGTTTLKPRTHDADDATFFHGIISFENGTVSV